MNSLTQKDEQGNWCLKGMRWADFRPGKVITEEMYGRLYGALWKLMEYEDTEIDPSGVRVLEGCYQKILTELREEKQKYKWIPVEERLPEHKKTVLVWTCLGGVEKAWYGYNSEKWHFVYKSEYVADDNKRVVAWIPLPEPYKIV